MLENMLVHSNKNTQDEVGPSVFSLVVLCFSSLFAYTLVHVIYPALRLFFVVPENDNHVSQFIRD